MNSLLKTIKDGEYMTRICVAANNEKLSISSDSLFTNNATHKQTTQNKKIAYHHDMIVGVLGLSELLTVHKKITFRELIQEYLEENISTNPIQKIKDIEKIILNQCHEYKFEQPCLLLFLWVHNNNFYMYYSQIHYVRSKYGFGDDGDAFITREIKPVTEQNYDKYCINEMVVSAGDGLDENPFIERKLYEDVFSRTFMEVKFAIQNENIPTVGGEVYSIITDIHCNFTTFINSKETKW